MKTGWEVKPLEAVCTLEKCKHDGSAAYYVGMENIASNTGQLAEPIANKQVKSDTFTFSDKHVLYGRLRAYLNKVLLPDFAGHCSTEVFPLMPAPQLDRRFLFYWLTADSTKERIDGTSTGARMPRANFKEVLKLEIPLPPLEEQRRIVAVLDKAFEGLNRARENTETNLANAQELFESKRRNFLTVESEAWTTKTLNEVCIVERGSSPRPIKNFVTDDEAGVNWVKIGDTKIGSKYVTSTRQRITKKGAEKSRAVYEGDFILTNSMTYGRPYIMGIDGYIHDGWFALRLKDEIDPDFFYHLLSSTVVQDQFAQLAAGSVVKNISGDLVKKAILSIPSISIQTSVANDLDRIFDDVECIKKSYTSKMTDLEDLRQSLLQKAFAGELT